ncbi:TPA: phage tail protein [Klebsiella pneumoniae]|uniref:phage tail tip fiber protein n=1 Tax=Klebsiella pneumoniae TaxID=573 RepID=UPI000ABE03D3|nr:phage tail protein [Klebsiella pneumoniae]VAO02854.1 putative phage tail protein [Klebsiella pneumoniae]
MEVPNFKKSRLSQLITHGLIISGRGGSKGGGGARTPVEANDTVNSRAMASVLDLLGEGVIGGLVDGAKSILLNDTPLQNADGSYNFSGVTWWFRDGSQDQTVIDGFDFIETPKSVGMQLKQTSQVNVSLDSADSDRVRVVMKFPSLRKIDKKSGDTNGTTVQYKFQIDAGNGKGFVDAIAEGEGSSIITLTAKKTGVYYRSYVFDLPKPAKSYTLRAIRLTEDHKDDSYLYDDTYIDSIGEIVNTSLNYPNSALVGLKINSEQFGSTMPSRSYLIKGLKIRVPSNYNADTNSYDGNWDGTFKLASSSNPAWILFDLLTNTRYGLGEFVKESMINIGELYQIGRYCDAFVDDGFGGKEKRFAINTQITSRQDAYRVVQDIAGAFRGMVYWAGGMVHITQDSPADPVMLFSNSNVVNGSFAYKGSARKDRYSVALITYNNKEDGYKQSVEYVEDQEAIKRYGIRKTESVAFGCTSRGQAHRVGLWTLYTSRMESDVITFAVGMDSVFLMPGDIVLIADKFRAGRRNSGRIIGYTSNSIKLDAPVDLTSVGNHITFLSAEGKMVERDILENGKNITTVTFKAALSSNETPVNDAVWVIAQPDLTPLQARVVSVAEGDDGTSFNITAIQNNPTKYEAIDSGAQLIPQNTTVLDPTFSKPSGLAITEGTYLSSPGNLSVSLTATWQGKSAQYYISWRRSDAGNVSNWKSERVTEEQFELRGVAENGQYDFQVYAVSVGGRKTDPISITYKVLGTMTAPDAPTGLTAVGDYRSIVLNWVNPASVDLDHIEVLASKTNDKSKAQLIAKVSGTTFSHNGLEDSVTWYYWVRAANKRGMLSALNSPLATVATTRDVLSFLQNKITESELGQDLIADINSKAVATEVDAAIDEAKSETKAQVDDARTEAANAVKSAKEALSTAIDKETKDRAQAIANETTARNKAIADEASIRATAISNEVTARTNAIAAEVEARTKAVADEATARAKAVSDEAIARASAITDSVAVEASNRAKAVSDATAALDAKISKEARDRASAVSALDIKTANAINTETLNRISSIEDEARARADALLQEKNNRQSEISNLSTQVQTVNESLAQQISQIAAGTGEQFDSLKIWYFDTNSEGWTEDDGGTVPMSVTDDGWLKSSNSTASCRSPNNMVIDANAYRFLKLRIKKVGKPTWSGKLYWIGASEQGWSESRSLVIDEPEYDANGVATLTIHDIDWRASTTIRRFRFDFLKNQSDTNNLLIDWVAVGRPTPGAGMAALQDEKSARVDADAAEAANRNALAVQMRGSYEGNDLSKVGSGLIFQEQLARVTADKAEAMARQSLETKVDDSVSNINKSLDTLNTQDKAMASDITGLKSSLKDKADASALQTLKTSVDQQGSSISTQGQSITKLQNDLSTTNANVSKKADQTALTALQGTVTQQGKDISAANSSITNLKTSLDTTNNNVAKKADATAVNDLTSRVSATEDKASSQADSIVQLNNSLNNAIADTDASAAMPNNLIVNPSFERGLDGYTGRSAATSVVEISTPHGGTRALKVDAGNVSPGQYVSFVQGRTYEIGVWVKDLGATTDNGAGNNKLRIGNSAGQPVFERPYNSGTIGSDWTLISGRWKATETAKLPVTLSNYLTAGSRCFDDFYVIDVTDSVKIDANASALSSLQNTVTQQGKDIASQSTSITSLSNQMVNGRQNMWVRSVYSVQLANNTTEPTFSDINGKAPISIDEVPDAAKLDFASAGSYVIAHYKAFVKVNADTTITMAPGSRVFDDTGAVYVNGVRVAFGNAGWNTVSFDLKAGWSTVEFLVNQWTGQAYINLGFKLSEKVAQLNSALGMNALSNAISAVTSNVSTVGDRVTSTSQSVTDLRNSLEQTNANLANKADAQALSTLQNTVTQQGKDIASASSSIASLQNNLSTTNANVAKKADATALNALQNTVTQQGKDITSASSDISLLKNSLATTDANVAKKADSSALSSLQSTVTQQGKDLSSVGNRTTNLENNLKTTDANVSKKADASAVDTLQNTVTQQGKDITSASDAITSLNNSVGAMTNMGDNLIQDANLEGDGSAFRTQQNSGTTGSIVAFGAYGENSAGARMLKVNATSPGLFANGKKPTPVNGSRKFRYIVRAKGVSGSMNMLLRRWNFNGSAEGNYEDKNVTLTSDWQTITWDTSFSPRTGADGQAFGIYCHPSNAEIWIDSFQVFDITDAVNNDATASALSDLSTKVTKQGDTVSSQGTSITKLQNDLTSTKTDVSKKADASALQTLQNTVTDQGKTLTSQGNAITALTGTVDTVKGDVAKKADATALNNLSTRVSNAEDKISSSSDAITSLNSSLNQQSKRGANILPDGTFESYSSGYNITNGRVIVTTDDSHGGNKCIRVTRPNDYNANATDNSDNHIFSGFQVRDNAVFYVECWVKLDAKSTTMDGSVQIAVGMSLQYQDNSWQWPALIKSAKDLSADTWTKVSGYLKSSKSGIKQAMVRISMPNVSTVKAGNSFLVDDFVITDVTDAYNAQQTADATASAVSTLQTTVSKQGDSITSQGDSITTLNNGLATANKAIGTKADASALQTLQNAVNQQGKDVASNTSNITALSNQIVNGKQGTWSRRIYKCQLSSAAAEPTFSDIQGLSPVFMDEVADAAKLDFSGAGSYVVAHYKAMVRVAADTTISVSPGSRVFDDSGAVYVNGVRQAVAISGTATLGFVLSSGWNTVEFLVNQWTGNAYINLGFKLGDKVAELYSGLGVSSLSTAINSINSNVNKVGDQTSSNSAAITSLKNSLSDTDSAVAKKADASALQTLQNTVTQQGKDIASQSDSVTNLSNALSNVSIGGVNLIKNSGDMAGWSGKTNEIFRGNAVISATTKAGSSYRDLKEITLDAPVDNAEYVYSFFAKGGENGQSMTAYFYNPNSTTSGVSSQGVSDGSVDGRMSFTLTTEWVRYWVKWKQKPGTGSKRIILARIQASSTKDQTVSITSPKLEVGNMPTEWSPAPSDMASSNDLSSLKTTVDANSSSIQSVTSRVQKTEDNISTQNTAITKLQGDLSTTNNLVSTKADSAALQTLQNSVTQQGKDISSQGTRVTSIENSLTSGANLIPNAKMLNGAQGWGGAATTVDGYAAVNSSAGWQPVSPLFEVTPGDTLDLSMMCLAGQAITVGWGLRFDGPSLSNATIYASNLSYQAGEKKAVSGTFVVPVGATTARLQPNTGATASLTVYNVVVTRRDAGTMANSSAIDSLTSTVQTQGDAISSVGGRTTSLENSLKTTNDNVSKKADSTTVQTLQNTVTQQGKDISAAGTNITSMQASLTRRTVFTVTAKGNGNSVTPGVFDESGKNLFTPGRSWALVTFAKQSDGSTVIATSKTYDVFGSANNGATMSADIEALASGTYVCVLTFDEPSGNRGKILSALESLGGTSEVVNSLPYRGAYILLGRKGMKPGDGLELRAPTGGDGTAHISTSVEFVNGVMMGLGAAGGVMMKADANASAITTLQNTVTQQGKDITSSSSAITSLQNGLVAANSNIDKKADATALQSLQNTVTQQGKDISTQSGNVTNLQNSLSATNTGLANLVADSDASKKIIGNLLTNSSFERGLEGFSGGASFIKVIDAQSPNSGSKILSCGAGTGTVSQSIAVTKDRTYKIGAFARCQSGTVVDNQSNNKLRIGNSSLLADFMFKPTDLPTGSTWKEISGTWKATVSGSVDVSINSSLKSGNQYFDDFYFIDITDIVNIDATSNAVASLTSRVTSAEGTVSSHTGSITNLSNSLNSLNNTVSGKADASALQSLQNTVTQQGKDLSSASGSITSLQSSLNTIKVQSNPWIDGTFETYDNNQQLGGSTAIVTTDFKSSGSKCLKVTRPANTSGNSDKTIGSYSAVRQSAKYRVEFWAMMPASEAPPSGWTVVVGLHSINKDGGNDWQGITFNEAGLGGRDQWVKFTGVVKVSPSVTRSHVWISTRGQSGSNTPGYAVYIDDFVITDITDAADAQATADANATAISSLQTKVSDIDGKVTAQTSQLSSMQSKVDASSSKVDQLSKTISDSQSTQASLNTSLQSQIDAQASANIKNQADLNSATTSIASIKSTQATQATQISAMAKTQTDMTASLNSQSASIQTLQEAVSNNDALNSTWMVKMQTNNNGQKYAAGIALGVDGKNMQSQFLVQADRFALINTSNGNTTTPFVIDNGVTYMNAAYIKDGSIGSAKVGDLMSSGFQENVRGWRISRDGTMNINGSGPGSSRTVITNGRIEVYDSNNRLRVRMGIF